VETSPSLKEDPALSPRFVVQEMPASRIRAMIVADDRITGRAFQAILEAEEYEVFWATSTAQALGILRQAACDILLCDLDLPDGDGSALMQEMLRLYPDMPVILMAARASVEMARQALQGGASDFITLPCPPGDLPIVVERNLTRHAVQKKTALRQKMATQTSNEAMLDALLSALDTRDTETPGHSERVTAYTMELADRLGLSERERFPIERGALLHDIGKIAIPDRILLKPGPLTPEEWTEIKKHPVTGYEMCCRIEMLEEAAQIVLHHHEAWDGSGYPHGLQGKTIPLGARLFALADTLDAITTDRPYRKAQGFSVACAEIEKNCGRQFDPELVRLFFSVPEARWETIRALADK
jgi:putative nucleotidyltransferase with HDIG domain